MATGGNTSWPLGLPLLWLGRLRELLDMIKFEHTIFALPFAFIGALAATRGPIPWDKYLWVLAAMVGARTLAMTFNRVADIDLDAENPRTSTRALPAGRLKPFAAWMMAGAAATLFGLAAKKLGPLPAKLAPCAFAVLLGYSITKRFTALTHAILGLALGIAPVGAWIAIAGKIEAPALWLSAGVIAWTAGFDIIYSLQDFEFDKKRGLHSVPAALGVPAALMASRCCHALAAFSWAIFLLMMRATLWAWLSFFVAAAILLREQWVMRGGDLKRLDYAFFSLNSFVGPTLFFGYLLHWLIAKA
jgi:4-hydroxybenzoate polyprenyltransferase